MTRQDAWEKSDIIGCDIIDEIYNAIESKVCKNCEYYKELDDCFSIQKDCTANDGAITIVSFPPENFGCVKFKG